MAPSAGRFKLIVGLVVSTVKVTEVELIFPAESFAKSVSVET
jgi:hypothetical protein